MNIDNLKNKQRHLPKALLCISGLLALLIAAKVSAFVINSDQIQKDIARTLNCPSRSEENIRKLQSKYNDASADLKNNNLFQSPPVAVVHKNNPVTRVTAVFDNMAWISDEWYEVGEKIGDAEITKISPNEVTIVWNDKESTLKPFDTVILESQSKHSSGGKDRNNGKLDKKDKKEKQPRPENMQEQRPKPRPQSPNDERKKRMQEYMNRLTPEQRAKFQERLKSRGSRGRGSRGSGGTRAPAKSSR